jgi:transcription antitermination factor NusG
MLWYVARTKPHKEPHAAAILQQHGIDTYLPRLRRRQPRPGRSLFQPLFPCYLFAQLRIPSDVWLAVRSAPNIAYFLGHQGTPTPLPSEFLAALSSRLERVNDEGGLARFTHGDRVIISHDQFQYLEAIFDRTLTATGRVRVLVQFINRQVTVDLPEDWLKRTS